MKKFIILLISTLIYFLPLKNSNAQTYNSGYCYTQKYYISDQCYGCTCQRAIWHTSSGGHYVYVWNGYSWSYIWRTGYYYWYTWITYYKC